MSNGSTSREDEICAYGQVNRTLISTNTEKLGELTGWMQRLEDKVAEALVAAMKRPGWAVCTIISVLLAACAILGTLLAAHISGGG